MGRKVRGWLTWMLARFGYWLRPYDMLADRRRWRWQPAQPCGFSGVHLEPVYDEAFEPRFPCRVMPTRHCPAVYGSVCGGRPCARYEANDERPWWPEVER